MAETDETVPKRPLTEAQLAARRANAQKSTGPKNTENSRFNAIVHGMRAALPVLPGESQPAYDERLDEWTEDFKPENSAQSFLVKRAVDLSFKMERGDSVEDALALDLMLKAQTEDDDQEEVEKLAAQLPEGGAAVVRQLRKTSLGCLRLVSMWGLLLHELETNRRLFSTARRRVLLLHGKQPSDVLRSDPVAIKWLTVLVGAAFGPTYDKAESLAGELGGKPPAGMSASEFDLRVKALAGAIPPQAQCFDLLRAYFAETLFELEHHLEAVRELEQDRRAIALQRARIDLAEDGKQLLRYQASHNGSFQAALRRLDAMQNPRQPRPPGRPRKARPEVVTTPVPDADITAATQGDGPSPDGLGCSGLGIGEVSTDTQVAVVSQAPTSGPEMAAAAITTGATVDTPIENPGAATNEAKNLGAEINPGAATNEAKNLGAETNPGAATNEAKNLGAEINPGAATNEAKNPLEAGLPGPDQPDGVTSPAPALQGLVDSFLIT